MIVYQADKASFLRQCNDEEIEEVIRASFKAATKGDVGESEIRSWRESLRYVARALTHHSVPDDVGVAVEFILPQSKKRIDVVLTGRAEDGSPHVIIVELKQWSAIKSTKRDAIVELREGRPSSTPAIRRGPTLRFSKVSTKRSMMESSGSIPAPTCITMCRTVSSTRRTTGLTSNVPHSS